VAKDRRKKQRRSPENTATKASRRRSNRRQVADRRTARRVDVDLWVEQERGKEVCFRHVGDLSVGGVRLDQGLSYPAGTRVRLRLTLPGDPEAVSVDAEIVGVSAGAVGAQTSLRFVGARPEDLVRINGFIDSVTERVRS
jgi:hypothetical protein